MIEWFFSLLIWLRYRPDTFCIITCFHLSYGNCAEFAAHFQIQMCPIPKQFCLFQTILAVFFSEIDSFAPNFFLSIFLSEFSWTLLLLFMKFLCISRESSQPTGSKMPTNCSRLFGNKIFDNRRRWAASIENHQIDVDETWYRRPIQLQWNGGIDIWCHRIFRSNGRLQIRQTRLTNDIRVPRRLVSSDASQTMRRLRSGSISFLQFARRRSDQSGDATFECGRQFGGMPMGDT